MNTTSEGLEPALRRFVEEITAADPDPEYGGPWHSSAFDLEFLTEEVNDALYGADYLGALEALSQIDTFVDQVRTALVITCRSSGSSWEDIGEALGRDRQWAWRTYHERADYSDELNEKALAEAGKNPVEFLAALKSDPKVGQALEMIERQALQRFERVRRALSLTYDRQRRALVEEEREAERAKTPGRRPGPQGSPPVGKRASS